MWKQLDSWQKHCAIAGLTRLMHMLRGLSPLAMYDWLFLISRRPDVSQCVQLMDYIQLYIMEKYTTSPKFDLN